MLNTKKESLLLTLGGTSGKRNNLWKDHFRAIENSVGTTDNRDLVVNALIKWIRTILTNKPFTEYNNKS